MNRLELIALLSDLTNQSGFRQLTHVMQDRIQIALGRAVSGQDPRVVAYHDGFAAGLEQEVDAWNESDDQIWDRARKYAGG